MRRLLISGWLPACWLVLLVPLASPASAQLTASAATAWQGKVDSALQRRAALPGRTRVIIRAADAGMRSALPILVSGAGGTAGRALSLIAATAATLPNSAIAALAANPLVAHVSVDRAVGGSMERTGTTVGATFARQHYGVDGSGVGIAIIDSGVTAWHDDISLTSRVTAFVDFVNHASSAYDDYGHGTHVAGIIAGSGYDSSGARSGIAPGASLIALKALNASGAGHVSDVIAALGYAVANKDALNIRVINLSIAAPVYESYSADPLTLAALSAVNAGIVVVAAAGNNGRSADGRGQYGGVTAPGNAPWVLTVGASSHMGTIDRSDDTVAVFSSRGPGAIDASAKPDLVAPGVGIESLSDPASAMYTSMASSLLPGTIPTSYLPYLSLSGTSMATPVVSGTIALMLQANPSLTPNAVKAILQYTAQVYPSWDPLTEGAGFLNTQGAVELARAFTAAWNATPSASMWGRRLVWGNRLYQGGSIAATASAWASTVTWGTAHTASGRPIAWSDGWNTDSPSTNVVWGTHCGGADCVATWSASVIASDDGDTVVWGTDDGDTVVWGTDDGDTVVWGTSCADPACYVIWAPR
jgi:serine protease AprX